MTRGQHLLILRSGVKGQGRMLNIDVKPSNKINPFYSANYNVIISLIHPSGVFCNVGIPYENAIYVTYRAIIGDI